MSYTNIIGFSLGGFCIGFGAAIGNGCTSGHGICGTARFSIRSFAFVILLMLFAFGTANLHYRLNESERFLHRRYFDGTIGNLNSLYWLIFG